MPEVLVIVPVYNELREVVHTTVGALRLAGFEVVVIDDGSQPPVARDLADERTHLLRHPVNLGQGAALETGMEFARRSGHRFVVHFDADGQHDVRAIVALLAPLRRDEADIVFGSRFLTPEGRRLIPPVRRWILRLGRIFNGLSTGVWMSDAHIGLRAMNRVALGRIRLRENRMAYATELLWQLRRHRLRWVEVPVEVVYTPYSRRKGQTSWNALRIVGDIVLRLIYR